MSAQFPYSRLPGVRRGLIRKAALWEGSDHILSVTGTRFSEQYRRFYYRDIQALVVQRRARSGSIGAWLLVIVLGALFALVGHFAAAATAWLRISSWIASSLLFLYLVSRLIISLKYSCRCYVQTAVTWEELPSLYRIWNTRKTLERMRGRIMESQGAWAGDPEALAETANLSHPLETARIPARKVEETEVAYSSAASMNWALLGCVALLGIAAFLFWYMDAPRQSVNRLGTIAANALLTSVAGAGFLFSLLRVYKVRALHSLRNFLFAGLILIGIHVYFSTVSARFYEQRDPLSVALSSPAFRHWYGLIDGGFSLGLGIFGVALVVFNWQNGSKGRVSNS